MSIALMMGDHIRQTVLKYSAELFQTLGHSVVLDDIWHDHAEIRPGFMKSTFYIHNVDNVKRKEFNALVAALQQQYPEIATFKVKFKRPDRPVRFYIEIHKPSHDI